MNSDIESNIASGKEGQQSGNTAQQAASNYIQQASALAANNSIQNQERKSQIRQQLNTAVSQSSDPAQKVIKEIALSTKKFVDQQVSQLKATNKQLEIDKERKILELKAQGFTDEQIEAETKYYDDQKKANDEQIKQSKELLAETIKASAKAEFSARAMADKLVSLGSSMSKYFDIVIANNNEYRNAINTRLQGLDETYDHWSSLQHKVTISFGTSMLLKEESILKNINDAVKQGIANNVEQRAMLQTLSDNIANTFNAFSNELTRFIRLQQTDTTTLMLGMESSLTSMFNAWYKDSSYMSQVGTDNISGALEEAMSMMNPYDASEFNFTVQKWLGSLYSLGMSQTGVSNLASAIGQLYSGNVNAISGEMQNLFAMSAARSGQSYADILTEGIEGSNINTLLQSMVTYLAEIAGSTNNVVESEYGRVFGMTVSDLKAATNLATSNIETVAAQSTDIGIMMGQVQNMINTIDKRLGLSGMTSNLISNFTYTTAANIVGTGTGQVIYEALKLLNNNLGDLNIFNPEIMGNAIGFNDITVSDIINAGLGAATIMSGIGTIIGGLYKGNALTNLSSEWWNTTTLSTSGKGFAGLGEGYVGKGKSIVGGSADITRIESTDAASSALNQQGYDESDVQPPENDIDDVYEEIAVLATELADIKSMLFINRKPILVDINSFGSLDIYDAENKSIKTNVVDGYINARLEGLQNDMGFGIIQELKNKW